MPRSKPLYTKQVTLFVTDKDLQNINQLMETTGCNRSIIFRAGLKLIFEKYGLPTDPLDP